MKFEWDEAKCAENIRARGLDFQDAVPVFFDPGRKIWEDDRKDYGEVRYNMLAENSGRVFAVTFTLPGWSGSCHFIPQSQQTGDQEVWPALSK